MKEAVSRVVQVLNRPESWDFTGAGSLSVGVDLGTYKAVAVVVDEQGVPRAASLRRAEIVRSGLILDFSGARTLLLEMLGEIRARSPLPIETGATSFPPNTETANRDATRYILEGAGLEVVEVLDEPSAANLVLGIQNGAVVDVGGGTTGIAVLEDGRVTYSDDEATGGVHLTLVLAGHLKVPFEEAERIKTDPARAREILPMVRPVIEKIASIVEAHLKKAGGRGEIALVGGTCALEGLPGIVAGLLGVPVTRPEAPQVITPLGIALSCLGGGRNRATAGKGGRGT